MNFRQQIEDFAKRFYLEGPGSVGEDLDSGKKRLVGPPQVFELSSLSLATSGGDGMERWLLTLPVPGSPGESGKTSDAGPVLTA